MMELTLGANILISIVVAVGTALLGYFHETTPEKFNKGKLIATVLVGLIVGVLTGALGWSYETAIEWLATGGLIVWIYWLAAIIARRLPNL